MLRIGNFVRRDHVGANGTKAIGALPLYPLTASVQLKIPLANVVNYAITRYVADGVRL